MRAERRATLVVLALAVAAGGCGGAGHSADAAAPRDLGMGGAGGHDLSSSGDLAGGGDLSSSGDLAGGGDLASGGDLATGFDLSPPPPDMACKTSIEDCFNGVDDNCDGLVDCADPQCTGGASPVAECVPDPGSAPGGTLASGACPTAYPTPTALYASLQPGSCATGSCACADGLSGTPTCSASLVARGTTTNSCAFGTSTVVFNGTNASGCMSFAALGASEYYRLSETLDGACFPPSGGSASKVAPTWGETDAFCGGSPVGGGCASGQICVPAAPNHCVLETGSQAACTVAGYTVPRATQYFTGYDDSGRSCACTCGASGSCLVDFSLAGNCTSGSKAAMGCYDAWSPYMSAQISPPGGATCTAGVTESGATSTSGFERTVCCTN